MQHGLLKAFDVQTVGTDTDLVASFTITCESAVRWNGVCGRLKLYCLARNSRSHKDWSDATVTAASVVQHRKGQVFGRDLQRGDESALDKKPKGA